MNLCVYTNLSTFVSYIIEVHDLQENTEMISHSTTKYHISNNMLFHKNYPIRLRYLDDKEDTPLMVMRVPPPTEPSLGLIELMDGIRVRRLSRPSVLRVAMPL